MTKQPAPAIDVLKRLAVVFENMIALAQEGEQYLSELHTAVSPRSPAFALHTRPTLLLVDDDGPLLRSMARSLKNDFEITTASSVEEALGLIEAQLFEMILSDFHLPDGDGLRVLNAFALANKSGVRVLYTGAALDAPIIRRHVEGGLVHLLVAKPVTPDILRAALIEEMQKERAR